MSRLVPLTMVVGGLVLTAAPRTAVAQHPDAIRLYNACYGRHRVKPRRLSARAARRLKRAAHFVARRLRRVPARRIDRFGQAMHQKVVGHFGLSSAGQRRVDRVARPLLKVGPRRDLPCRIYALKGPIVNAIALPGNRIYVFGGLLRRMRSDQELAAIIAHEMGHTTARHTEYRYKLYLAAGRLGRFAALARRAFALIKAAYDQEEEHEADALGICLLRQACLEPAAGIRALQSLARWKPTYTPRGRIQRVLRDYLSTHPAPGARLVRLRRWLKALRGRPARCGPSVPFAP